MNGTIRNARDTDAAEVLAIYAPYIEGTAVSFEYAVPSEAEMRNRIAEVQSLAPWLVFEVDGKVVGYAYASKHRARAAYQWSVEVSAYVAAAFHHQGIATALYRRLFEELVRMGFHVALAGITLPNEASRKFHESLGFTPVGIYHNIGYKFERWHDVGWWEKML